MRQLLSNATVICCAALLGCILLMFPAPAAARLQLADAAVETLDNGLTVIVLEDRTFPVVSVQMLYRVGARNENPGETGLAHFVEHMAFRQSENFPDTGLVSSIYAVGGEWHGYTWLDQTTYFATTQASDLELLLQIEADRMAKLKILAKDVESERGAVLTEMHGYENDPASVLHDNVLYLSFLAHPYRNNTIGWESDVVNTGYTEVVSFYERHYQPGNAILAVAGDVSTDRVMQLVRQYFSALQGRPPTPAPHTVEPLQSGERRIRLQGATNRKYFEIAYRAPGVNRPDYVAFLLAQDLLAAGSGVSFLQNDWGTPARSGSALDGIASDLSTWFPPSAQDYVLTISGSQPGNADEGLTEQAIENGIEKLRVQFSQDDETSREALRQSVERVQRELVFDVQTTEDAAHQLAFFTGLDALDTLIELPDLLTQVRVKDVHRVLNNYFSPRQRTIGWYVPAPRNATELQAETGQLLPPDTVTVPAAKDIELVPGRSQSTHAGQATLSHLSNGTAVIIQQSTLSPTAMLKVIVPDADFMPGEGVEVSEPAPGLTALDFRVLSGNLEAAIDRARELISNAKPVSASIPENDNDPRSVLNQAFQDILNHRLDDSPPGGPVVIVVTGDMQPIKVRQWLEQAFAGMPAGPWKIPPEIDPPPRTETEKRTRIPIAQETLGYLALVPQPTKETAAAWQMALYVFTHGYEGRLGKEAISRRGLVYYIGSAFNSDGRNQWITLETGVDPGKMLAMKQMLRDQLDLLLANPPSQQEIDEARRHLLGRELSAAQSNTELAEKLAGQWILYGGLPDAGEFKRLLTVVSRRDVLDLLPAFTNGTMVSVRNPGPVDR